MHGTTRHIPIAVFFEVSSKLPLLFILTGTPLSCPPPFKQSGGGANGGNSGSGGGGGGARAAVSPSAPPAPAKAEPATPIYSHYSPGVLPPNWNQVSRSQMMGGGTAAAIDITTKMKDFIELLMNKTSDPKEHGESATRARLPRCSA